MLAIAGAVLISTGSPTSVMCYSDRFLPSEGVVVQAVSSAGDVATTVSNSSGFTPFFNLPLFDVAGITLAETNSRAGVLVGTVYEILTPPVDLAAAGVDDWYHNLTLSQPLASRHVISGSLRDDKAYFPPDIEGYWSLSVSSGTELRFATSIALLPNNREIKGALRYLSFTPPALDEYRLGVLMNMPTVHLGADPHVAVHLDGKYSGFSSQPTLDVFLLKESAPAGSPPSQPLEPLEAEIVWWEDEIASITLTGTCEEGKLFLLLRPSGGAVGETSTHVYTPPSFQIPQDGGDGETASLGRGDAHFAGLRASVGLGESSVHVGAMSGLHVPCQIRNCQPQAPLPSDGSCDPPGFNGFDDCPVTLIETDCSSDPKPTTNVKCGNAGVGVSLGETSTWVTGILVEGTVSTGATAPGKAIGGGLTLEGKWQTESTVTNSYTAQSGNGYGECFQWFTVATTCRATYSAKRDRVVWEFFPYPHRKVYPCEDERQVKKFCHEQEDSGEVCSRTCE